MVDFRAMNTNWTPLWSDILQSSLWTLGKPGLPEKVRERGKNAKLLFLTMIASANQEGFVSAAIDGLAYQARLTDDETEAALEVLEGPDKSSRCKDDEGRRVKRVDGGWVINGYQRQWERMAEERRKAQLRKAAMRYRAKKKGVDVDSVENRQELADQCRAQAKSSTRMANKIEAELEEAAKANGQ